MPGLVWGAGRIRVAALTGDTLRESEGEAGLTALRASLDDPKTTVWVDMTDPSPAQVQAVGTALKLHPLIIEDVLEGNQRAKIETTNGVIHIVLFALTHGKRFVASEIDLVLGLGFCSLCMAALGSAKRPSPALGARADQARGRTTLGRSATTSSRLLPVRRRPGRGTIASGRDHHASTPARSRVFALKRELIEVRARPADARAFAQLTTVIPAHR